MNLEHTFKIKFHPFVRLIFSRLPTILFPLNSVIKMVIKFFNFYILWIYFLNNYFIYIVKCIYNIVRIFEFLYNLKRKTAVS